jgi:hypothetical protein
MFSRIGLCVESEGGLEELLGIDIDGELFSDVAEIGWSTLDLAIRRDIRLGRAGGVSSS